MKTGEADEAQLTGLLEQQKGIRTPSDLVGLAVGTVIALFFLRQVLSTLELSDAPVEAIEIIRGPVLLASERASKRYVPSTSGTPEAPQGSEGEASGNDLEQIGVSANA